MTEAEMQGTESEQRRIKELEERIELLLETIRELDYDWWWRHVGRWRSRG